MFRKAYGILAGENESALSRWWEQISDNTGCRAVMLRPVKFQRAGSWISTFTLLYSQHTSSSPYHICILTLRLGAGP